MHNSIWRLLWRAVSLTALLPLVVSLCALQDGLAETQAAPGDPSKPPQLAGIYDPDPHHIWNRLFVTFYRQKVTNAIFRDGDLAGWVGPDVLDPPIGYQPRFLLEDEPFGKCNALLDEFLSRNGAALIRDPLKRTLLQRDLWAVFDVLAQAGQDPSAHVGEPGPPLRSPMQERRRTTLERKLAQVIHSLALSRKEIEHLPDTYAAAIQSGAFTDILATNRYDYLPHDLFSANAGWHEIKPGYHSMSDPPILQHTLIAGGRCIFRVFVKLPVGANETNILDRVAVAGSRFNTNRSGALPRETQFLLLREMITLDENGQMVPTHVVESVQFRTVTPTHGFVREAELSRALLFQGQQGGLRPIPKGEPRVRMYNSLGHLHTDEKGNGLPQIGFPRDCSDCHALSVLNQALMFSHVAAFAPPVRSVSIEPIARWKEESGKLDLLRKFIASPASNGK
jgi:hypothetical protein